jgi:hypothetical protein
MPRSLSSSNSPLSDVFTDLNSLPPGSSTATTRNSSQALTNAFTALELCTLRKRALIYVKVEKDAK